MPQTRRPFIYVTYSVNYFYQFDKNHLKSTCDLKNKMVFNVEARRHEEKHQFQSMSPSKEHKPTHVIILIVSLKLELSSLLLIAFASLHHLHLYKFKFQKPPLSPLFVNPLWPLSLMAAPNGYAFFPYQHHSISARYMFAFRLLFFVGFTIKP